MSSGSLKELTKTLHSIFSVPLSPRASQSLYKNRSRELTPDARHSIEAYIDKHEDPDDNDSQRLHDELLTIYQKYVLHEDAKLGAFLDVLQLLRPKLNGQGRLQDWWDIAIEPVMSGSGHKKKEIERATEFLLPILDYDAEADVAVEKSISGVFLKQLLGSYLKRTRVLDPDAEALSFQDDDVARQLENVLINFGRRKPKDLLQAIDRLVVDKSHRMQALGLLSSFVRQQPPHLYLVSQTPLIEHLLKCLMIDTSSTVISLALACLIMFLPHIPSSVKTHLPRLFLIYSRILCWERFFPTSLEGDRERTIEDDVEESSENVDERQEVTEDEEWEKLTSSFDAAESTAPELIHYFTFLYGLYPLNFTNYVRKPRRYLKDIKFPRAEDFDLDQTIIRSRTEQFRRVHLIHPNFYTTTAKDELTDNRWLKSDPSDVVSECMGLCIATAAVPQEIGPQGGPDMAPHFLRTEDIPRQSLSEIDDDAGALLNKPTEDTNIDDVRSENVAPSSKGSSRAGPPTSIPGLSTPNTSSPAPRSPESQPATDEPDGSATPAARAHPHPYLDTLSNKQSSVSSFPSTSNQSPRVGPTSRSLMPRSPAIRPAPQGEANLAFLQREVMLLRNELNFERYLKQQQLTHIGQLQRRHIAEATVEAETQNLINTNRVLKARLAKANEAYASIKKEAATGRNHSKKWEAELSNRVKTLRENEKQWRLEEESLRFEASRVRKDCDSLRRLVVESEARELLARQELTFAEIKLEKVDNLAARIGELEESIREYEAKDLISAQRHDENERLKQQLAAAKLTTESQDAGHDEVRRRFDSRIRELELQVFAAQNPTAGGPPGQLAPHVQMLLDNAVAGLSAKYATLQKEGEVLKRRNAELEMRLKS